MAGRIVRRTITGLGELVIDVQILRAAGLSDAQIIAVLAAEQVAEAEKLAARRQARRIGQRRYREKISNKNNGRVTDVTDVTVTSVTPLSPSPPPSMVSPITPSLTTPSTSSLTFSRSFDRFWKAYPKKKAKKAAEKALAKALRETSIAVILDALAKQGASWTDPQFIPHPATWLNAGRWMDEPQVNGGHVNGTGNPLMAALDKLIAGTAEAEGADDPPMRDVTPTGGPRDEAVAWLFPPRKAAGP